MAIFSLHHSFVGRTTHPAGAAGAYVRYITRSEACTRILGERMPLDGRVYAWLDEQENGDRKNARVVDRVVVALPVELNRDQNAELLQAFGERMSEGRTPWMTAIHDGPRDADNPHAHIVFRDRDVDTGRRVMLTTENGSTQRFRQAWEEEVNKALERAGLEVRVDRRSLADQGIDREPQIHVGQAAQRLAERDHEFESSAKQITRRVHGTPGEVTVNYPEIDQGLSRAEENEARKLRNWVRAQEAIALNGPFRPEELPAMDRVALTNFRLDARYREALRSGEVPAEDGDPVSTAVREYIAFCGHKTSDRPKGEGVPATNELLWPIHGYGTGEAFPSGEEVKRRKEEYDKLKEEPGMARVLHARDYLNALSFERGESGPSDEDLKAYLVWAETNRIPTTENRRERPAERFESLAYEPGERAPRRDVTDLIRGGGLAAIGKIADSLETLFDDPRPARQIERDEIMSTEKQRIEQLNKAEQERQQQAEAEKWRMKELDLYLAQRARERGIERGR